MISNIGFGTYFVFAACTSLSIPFVWFMVPETKGMKLEEVDALFIGRGLVPRMRTDLQWNGPVDGGKEASEQTEGV